MSAPIPLTPVSPRRAGDPSSSRLASSITSDAGPSRQRYKTVAVLGASYGGARAAKLLSQGLPAGWRLVVIDRNSHMNHVYVFPRFTVIPSHAPKAYIPYVNHLLAEHPSTRPPSPTKDPLTPPLTPRSSSSSLELDKAAMHDPHSWVQGMITSLTPKSVTFHRIPSDRRRGSAGSTSSAGTAQSSAWNEFTPFEGSEETIEFDYALYALGAGLPDPVNVWKPAYGADSPEDFELSPGSKRCGVRFMQKQAKQMERAQRILIVGAGALGIQYATDLKEIYPEKQVTLLHSRLRLMSIYPIEMHTAIVENLEKLGVEVVLGERVVTWPENPGCVDGEEKHVTTDKGREFTADLVLACTGQRPHVSMMAAMCPSAISPATNRIRVHSTMQVSNGPLRPAGTRANTLEKLGALSLHALPTPPSSASSTEEQDRTPIAITGSSPFAQSDSTGHGEAEEEHHPDLSHFFAVGDCAETGAIQAGHTAYYQAEVAARNILRMIKAEEEDVEVEKLEEYRVSIPAIKVTLGMKTAVIANADGVKVDHTGVEDLHAMIMWPGFQADHMDVNE